VKIKKTVNTLVVGQSQEALCRDGGIRRRRKGGGGKERIKDKEYD
jgi:hypothetical protein